MSDQEDWDFGFTAVDYDPLETTNLQDKLIAVEALIMPLLENLKLNPEKEFIHWPNRVEVIDKQIAKIKAITRG